MTTIKKINFVKIKYTETISFSNNLCTFNCKHCNHKYLFNMKKFEDIYSLINKGYNSFLLSGGYDKNNKITILDKFDFLIRLKKEYGLKYNIHVGNLDNQDEIYKYKLLHDNIDYDLVGNIETYKYVYNKDFFEKKWNDFDLLIKNGFNVTPHITIGLNKGLIEHEYEALKKLTKYKKNISKIIFLVIIPTKGTYFENIRLPEILDVLDVFKYAKSNFFDKEIILGCMHPKGVYREKLQNSLLSITDTIVQPINKTIETAELNNYDITYKYQCCSL